MFNYQMDDRMKEPLRAFSFMSRATSWADESAPEVLAAVRAETPVRTGKLKDSQYYRRETRPGRVRLCVVTKVPYAPFVIHGTKPHIIAARNAKALHWKAADGSDRFATMVHHPGTKPNPYGRRAADRSKPVWDAKFKQIVGGPPK